MGIKELLFILLLLFSTLKGPFDETQKHVRTDERAELQIWHSDPCQKPESGQPDEGRNPSLVQSEASCPATNP